MFTDLGLPTTPEDALLYFLECHEVMLTMPVNLTDEEYLEVCHREPVGERCWKVIKAARQYLKHPNDRFKRALITKIKDLHVFDVVDHDLEGAIMALYGYVPISIEAARKHSDCAFFVLSGDDQPVMVDRMYKDDDPEGYARGQAYTLYDSIGGMIAHLYWGYFYYVPDRITLEDAQPGQSA